MILDFHGQVMFLQGLFQHNDNGSGTIANSRGGFCRVDSLFFKDGSQFGHLFGCGLWTWVFVRVDYLGTLAGFDFNGNHFGIKNTRLFGLAPKLLTLQQKGVTFLKYIYINV